MSQNKKTSFQRLEAVVEKAASMIDKHAGIPGIAVSRELRRALRDFKHKGGER